MSGPSGAFPGGPRTWWWGTGGGLCPEISLGREAPVSCLLYAPQPGLPHCQGDGIIPIYLSGSGLVPTCPPAPCLSLLWQWGDASRLPPYLQLAPLPAARCREHHVLGVHHGEPRAEDWGGECPGHVAGGPGPPNTGILGSTAYSTHWGVRKVVPKPAGNLVLARSPNRSSPEA